MAKVDLLNILYSKNKSPLEFEFDSLWLPSLYNYIYPETVQKLYNIASSLKYSSKTELKYKMISDIMHNFGFEKFHAGTNRIVFRYYEDQSFVAKIAIDRVGLGDNPAEFENQKVLKPFVTKVFETSPCGSIALVERVEPIKNKAEFESMYEDVFYVLYNHIIGKYVLEDIGTKYFMNWGVRKGFGPCLLDFPYVYKIDGNKLFCTVPITPNTRFPVCGGEIDYDSGFNNLVCTKCGKKYIAANLKDPKEKSTIIVKGDDDMAIRLLGKNGKVLYEYGLSSDVINPPKPKKPSYSETTQVKLIWKEEPKQEIPDKPPEPDVEHQKPVNTKVESKVQPPKPTVVKKATDNKQHSSQKKTTAVQDKKETATKSTSTAKQSVAAKKEKESQEKVQFIVYNVLKETANKYPFDEDEKADKKHRAKLKEYLMNALELYIKASNLSTDFTVEQIVDQFIDIEYTFNDDEDETTVEDTDDSISSQFGIDPSEFEEPNFEKIRPSNKKSVLDQY